MNKLAMILFASVLSAQSFGYWACVSADSPASEKGRLAVNLNTTQKKATIAILRNDLIELTGNDTGWYYLGWAEKLNVETEEGTLTAKAKLFDFSMNVSKKSASKLCGKSKVCHDAVVTTTTSIKVRKIEKQKLTCIQAR